MVICKYFLNGNCRFGTKCVNEHFDVKPIIKTEVEAALKGSQWPLSCFGPFREKPCIPNFIEDQSFEEIRNLCYEAKKQNCFPQFHQQFTQQVMDAQNKMKALLSLNRDVVEILINLYNSADLTKKTPQQTANPFSMVNGNKSVNQTTTTTASLFGNNLAQSNPFGGPVFGAGSTATNSGSIFGGRQTANSTSINSFGSGFGNQQRPLFGQQTTPFGQNSATMFATGTQQQQQQQSQQPSMFGGSSQNQPSIFGSTTGFGNSTQSNLFGQPTLQQPQQPGISGNSIFSQQNQQTSGFGSFGQPQVQPQQTTTFGIQQTQITPTTGLFNQQQTQQNQNIFGSPQVQQNMFGQQTNQQQNMFNMQKPSNLFGTSGQEQQQHQMQNLTSSFGNTQQMGEQTQIQNALVSGFGNMQQQIQPQQQQLQLQQPPQQSGNIFGQNQQQNHFQQIGTHNFGESNQQQILFVGVVDDIPISENLYSKMCELKQEELEAFKADKFEIGKIPTNPPPRELV